MNDGMNNPIRTAINDCLSGAENHPSLESRVLARVDGKRRGPVRLSAAMALGLMLTMLAAAALAIGAFTGLFRLEQTDLGAFRDCVSTGDTLYLMSSSGMYTWTPDESEPTLLLSEDKLHENGLSFEALLYWNGDAIGILDQQSKTLWEYQNGELNLLLDYSGTPMALSDMRYESAVYQDGWLFLTAQPLEDAMEGEALLYRADPLNGKIEHLSITGTLELCNYAQGEILVLQRDGVKREDRLVALDTKDGTIQKILYTTHVQGMEGMAYDQVKNELYALADGKISRWENGGWKALQGYASHHLTDAYAIVGEGYVSVSFNGMQYVPFDWENDLVTLTIRGYIAAYNADEDFQRVHSGVAVVREREPTLTAEEVRKAIEEGDTTDLFHLRMDGDLVRLIRDGLIAPLVFSNALIADAQAMTPVIQSSVFDGGLLYAVPSLMLPMVWQGECVIPETYQNLMAIIDEAEGNSLMIAGKWAENPWTQKDYANYLLETYIAEAGKEDGFLDFHEETFVNALTALKSVTLPTILDSLANKNVNPYKVMDLGGAFPENLPESGIRFYEQEAALQTRKDEPHWLLPPTINGKAKHSVPVCMIVYVLNPNAQHPNAAMKYMEFIAAKREPGDEGLFKPEKAKPVLHPAMQRNINNTMETHRNEDKARQKKTDEAALQAYAGAVRAAADSWAITENRLDTYRKVFLPYLDLRLDPLLASSSKKEGGRYNLLLEEMLEYMAGNRTLPQCLDDMQIIAEQ
ncbi:MAG: hypothetical protein RR653_10940 [Clostridia bacterium]